ncbi:MAG: cysteine desulfurase CsdA [Bdellovibrionales bacterium CG10_big_fil_rev_8_21_14_0_10_45_34]|nr:MAG: cysteine desulfurase CsdA [Bdellovibrionales bacterium CG10_big_fil_rev_8_21_14_0_10_45_34]
MKSYRDDFPNLKRQINGQLLTYLDSAATSFKPKVVIERIHRAYENEVSNVHRGIHGLSNEATTNFESARSKVAQFLRAANPDEIVFTRGTTESINLVAHSYVAPKIQDGGKSNVVITKLEHHSNIVPWLLLKERAGLEVRFAEIFDEGNLNLEHLQSLIDENTLLVSVTATSNTLGINVPVTQVANICKSKNVPLLVDAAQSTAHAPTDVAKLGVDFLAFSAHKTFGPSGIGVLWGRRELLNSMPPFMGGGSMISDVNETRATYLDSPHRFEAGTPHIVGALGLAEALNYIDETGWDEIQAHDRDITQYAFERLNQVEGLRILGTHPDRTAIFSFVLDRHHHQDVAMILDQLGIAVRSGHHCTQPLMKRLGVTGTLRASFALYNNHEDVDRLIYGLQKAQRMLG